MRIVGCYFCYEVSQRWNALHEKASKSNVVQTSDSVPKAGPSKQPDLITTRTSISMTQASIQSDAQPMETDHYGPPLTPKPTQSIQSEHASRHLDLDSDHSDHHSESEQPRKGVFKSQKTFWQNEA